MKFPKSVHAEGWGDHIETAATTKRSNPLGPAGSRRGAGVKISSTAPLQDASPAASAAHLSAMSAPPVMPSVTAPTVAPRVEPIAATVRPQHRAAALPPQRDNKLSWMIAAGAGAAVIASVAIWAANRPTTPSTPPAAVIGSTEAPTQVAAATPELPPAADRDDTVAATPATTTPEPTAEPARLGPPVTTVKPAVEPRQMAQADVPAPRPDLVTRATPRSGALQPLQPAPTPAPTLQAPTTVAAAPAMPLASDTQPVTIPQGNAPITLPPTAAGPMSTSPGTPPQALPSTSPGTPPVATATPDTSATPVNPVVTPVTPPLAQAPAQPVVEDSGITLKVRSALANDATLAAVPIAVSTDHGVVKLEGQAPDAPTRERATVVASSATGVKAVDNRLTLPPAAVVSQAPAQSGL